MRPRSYKHPPQGTNRVGSGPLVTKPEHERAVFANRVLHEIGDEDIWKLREALLDPSYSPNDPDVAELTAKLKGRYRNG